MVNIKIPYALNESRQLVNIDDSDKNEKYLCPGCNAPVIVRKGEIRVHHYSHKASQVCNQETVTHKLAKLLLQRRISEWKEGQSPPPCIKRACQVCHTSVAQPLPEKVECAELEVRLSDSSIVDVALMSANIPVAGIEVRVTHAVDKKKIASLPIPFIEVDGNEIINCENPIRVLVDKFMPVICPDCKTLYQSYHERARIIANEARQPLPNSYYRFAIAKCWKCKKNILVYSWPTNSGFENSEPLNRHRPSTIKIRNSNAFTESYWANHCPYCESIQGDYYLYSEPDGPFFNFECDVHTDENFRVDMIKIARWDAYLSRWCLFR